jgi:hypothetical protein
MSLAAAYRGLLRLFPRDYHDAFAKEMLKVFESAIEDHRQTRFVLTEFAGLLAGVTKEWAAKLTTDRAVRGRCLPDLRMMRPAGVSKEAWFSAAALDAYHEAKS